MFLFDIISIIKKAAVEAVESSKPFCAVTGTVVSASPLSIEISPYIVLNSEQLILTDAVRDYSTEISFDDSSVKNGVSIGHRIPDAHALLISDPDTPAETSKEVILTGELSFQNKVKHKITVYNALKAGEAVTLLRLQGGQKYIVLDRVKQRGD